MVETLDTKESTFERERERERERCRQPSKIMSFILRGQ